MMLDTIPTFTSNKLIRVILTERVVIQGNPNGTQAIIKVQKRA